MFAIVTKFDKKPVSRRYQIEFSDPVCRISVGSKVSRRTLSRLLEPFNGRFIATDDVFLHRLKPICLREQRESLLFTQFCDHALSMTGIALSIGIFDPAGRYLDRREIAELIAHASSTTIFTFKNADLQCREWLSLTGTCPEIVEKKAWLFGCDCVFAPQGLTGFEGVLFGEGGYGIDQSKLDIPEHIRQFVSDKVDLTDLYCLLKAEVPNPVLIW